MTPALRISDTACRLLRCVMLICVSLCLTMTLTRAGSFKLGANVNENLTHLEKNLLDRSETIWVRGFLPATEFISGRRILTDDAGIRTLQRCSHEGRKVIVSIKWDFRAAQWRVPLPGSEREQECFAFADSLLDELRGQISILALVNEVFVDTLPADMQPGENGIIPMVRFLQRLAEHVHARGELDPQGQPLRISCGGFTRLDTPEMQTSQATFDLMKWCESSPAISVVNYHLHQRNYDQWKESLGFIRRHVPTKPLIVTEYSMIWQYKAHLVDRLDSSERGDAFAKRYSIPGDMTVREYINRCIASPVPETTWEDFLNSQSWMDPDFLKRTSVIMAQHGVIVATYAFSQRSSGGNRPLRPNATPWLLNPIFIPVVAVATDTNLTAVNVDWFAEYLRQRKTAETSK